MATSESWATPPAFFAKLHEEFQFNTDVCAAPENAKCAHYFTKDTDGLQQQWHGTCWMNPPYGLPLRAWVKKAYESSLLGTIVVCLVPARTDTQWWHDYAAKAEVRFVKGRIKFVGAEHTAPFPSVGLIFRPEP